MTAERWDVAYTTMESPYGELLLATTEIGLVAVALPDSDQEGTLAMLGNRISPRMGEDRGQLGEAVRQLEAYFAGELQEFDLPLDRRLATGFTQRALDAIGAIEYGETATYAEIAARAGSPRAHRAAGSACATNPLAIVIPCHRVLSSGGGLGGYGGGLAMKRALLNLERLL